MQGAAHPHHLGGGGGPLQLPWHRHPARESASAHPATSGGASWPRRRLPLQHWQRRRCPLPTPTRQGQWSVRLAHPLHRATGLRTFSHAGGSTFRIAEMMTYIFS